MHRILLNDAQPSYWKQATKELAQKDAVLRNLICCFKQEKIVSRSCASTLNCGAADFC